MIHKLRLFFKVSSIFIIQLYITSNVDLLYAFQSFQESKVLQSNTLAIDSKVIMGKLTVGLDERLSSKIYPFVPIVEKMEDKTSQKIAKELEEFADSNFTGAYITWLESSDGSKRIQGLRRRVTQGLGFPVAYMDTRHVAEGLWLLMSTRQGVPENVEQINAFVNKYDKEGGGGDLQTFLERHFQSIQKSRHLEEGSFVNTHRSEVKEEVIKVVRMMRRYRQVDIEDTPKAWDLAYDRFINTAEKLLRQKSFSFSRRDNVNSILGGEIDVFNEILWPMSDFSLQGIMTKDVQKEDIRTQVLDLLQVFKMSGQPDPPKGTGKGSSSSDREYFRNHFVADTIYRMFTSYQERMTYIERGEDLVDPNQSHMAKTLGELWKDGCRAYHDSLGKPLKERDLEAFAVSKGLDYKTLSKVTLGTFRLTKKWVNVSSMTEIIQYPSYTDDRKNRAVRILDAVLRGLGYFGIVVGIFILFVSSNLGLTIILGALTYILVLNGLKSFWKLLKTPASYTSFAQKIFVTFLVLVATTITLLLLFFAAPIIVNLIGFLGLAPLVSFSSYFLAAIVFRIATGMMFNRYVNTYMTEDRDFVGFMQKKVNNSLQALQFGEKATIQVDRNSVVGRYLGDMVGLGRMLKEVYINPELRHASQTEDEPLNYTGTTIAMFYDKIKERTKNLSFFGSDRYRQSDINLKAMIDEMRDERERILSGDQGSLLSRFNQFERGMDLREYAMVHQYKMFHDSEIVTTELVNGKEDKAVTHALSLGLEEVDSLVQQAESSFYVRDKKFNLKDALDKILGKNPKSPDNIKEIKSFSEKLEGSDVGHFYEEVIRPLTQIYKYHLRNQELVQKLDRQRADNYGTEKRLQVAEDFWEWGESNETGKDLDLLELFEGKEKKVEVYKGADYVPEKTEKDSNFEANYKGKTVVIFKQERLNLSKKIRHDLRVILPEDFYDLWEDYKTKKHRIKDNTANPKTMQEIIESQKKISEFSLARTKVVDLLFIFWNVQRKNRTFFCMELTNMDC